MIDLRRFVSRAPLMIALCALAWAAACLAIAANAGAIWPEPDGGGRGAVARAAAWLVAPTALAALPAWFLSRAGLAAGLGPERGRMTRWFVGAWVLDALALLATLIVLWWHAKAGPGTPAVDLPVLILGLWAFAFTAWVPALIAVQARRREAEEVARFDPAERDPGGDPGP